MLSGKGFSEVYNLAGGIKGWNSETAFGAGELGLSYFEGAETPETNLIVAYSLEQGLRDFYLSMIPKVKSASLKRNPPASEVSVPPSKSATIFRGPSP